MSRITVVRSTTGRPSASSRLRSWRARQLVVAGDQVGVARLRRAAFASRDLARAEIGVRVRLLAPLDQLPDDRHAGRAQQLAQLGQVVAVAAGRRCRGRAGARALSLRLVRRPSTAAVAIALDRLAVDPVPSGSTVSRERAQSLDGLEQALVGGRQRDPKPALAARARRSAPGESTTAASLEHVLAVGRRAVEAVRHRRPHVDRAVRRPHLHADPAQRVADEVAAARGRARSSTRPPRRRPARAPRRRRAAPPRTGPSRCWSSAASRSRAPARFRPPPRSASRSCCSPWTARRPRCRRPWPRASPGTTARGSRRRRSPSRRCRARRGSRRRARTRRRARRSPPARPRRSGCSGS